MRAQMIQSNILHKSNKDDKRILDGEEHVICNSYCRHVVSTPRGCLQLDDSSNLYSPCVSASLLFVQHLRLTLLTVKGIVIISKKTNSKKNLKKRNTGWGCERDSFTPCRFARTNRIPITTNAMTTAPITPKAIPSIAPCVSVAWANTPGTHRAITSKHESWREERKTICGQTQYKESLE
jgi:hypothetical protein